MRNFIQPGEMLDAVAPSGGVTAGVPVKIGTALLIPSKSAAEGASFAGAHQGCFEVPAATGQAWAANAFPLVYWDDTNKVFTTTASGNTKAGIAIAAKASDGAVGSVKLIPTL